MQYLLFFLGALCLMLLVRLYSMEQNLREGARELHQRRVKRAAAPLHLAAPHGASEALLAEINGLLRDGENDRADFRHREQAIRRQIANVSHDLRTPLTSILGYLQLLDSPEVTEGQRKEYLSIIENRSRVLQGLITSFYDLSRMEAGEYPITRERVDLREIIGELLAAFYDELESQFQVMVDLPEDLPPVWGDRAAMTRVYTNLIRNALEHGRDTFSISAKQEEGKVTTVFSNGGGTLLPEDLPRVFDRFFTADQTRSGRNTGLGLAIVKVLTQQMEGEAEAMQEGEIFSVLLSWKW